MTARQLQVSINGQRVGHLREENDLWTFEYVEAWVVSEVGFDLSPALSRQSLVHADGASDRPVQWYFDNLLPEEALRTVLAKEARLPTDDAFGLLAYFGGESAGSLVLLDPQKPMAEVHGLQPLSYEQLSQRIRNLPRVSLTQASPKKMSLAGAQHKMVVVLKGDQLFEPLSATASTHILKPNHQEGEYAASVMNEYFVMRLAAAVGLEVPDVQRFYIPEPVYIVKRFDRLTTQNDEAERRHVIDACQLLNKARNFKYSGAHIETLSQAIAQCRSKISARLQLYRWIVFNLLIGNSDNHLKNISFLVDASGINLAPTYDLLSTAVYDTQAMADQNARWPHTELAFTLGDAATFARVSRTHVLAAGKALGLNEATATRELDTLIRSIAAEAEKLLDEIEGSREELMAKSPDPAVTQTYQASEMQMLRVIRHVVLADMMRQLS